VGSSWKAKVGKPALKEWEDVSRKVFDRLNEMLDARDDDGKLMYSPALLTAASRLIIESETLYKNPENVETNKLQEQPSAMYDHQYMRFSSLTQTVWATTSYPIPKTPTPLFEVHDYI
jgi:hypothetical protein